MFWTELFAYSLINPYNRKMNKISIGLSGKFVPQKI